MTENVSNDGMIVDTARSPRHVKPGDRVLHVTTGQTGAVVGVGPNALDVDIEGDDVSRWSGISTVWELLAPADTGASTDTAVEVYVNGKFVRSEPETSEGRKIRVAAEELENLTVMLRQAALDLRSASRVTGANAADPTRAIHEAYARTYVLRRRLSRVVATLGAGMPARLGAYEAEYDRLVQD